MRKLPIIFFISLCAVWSLDAQSGRVKIYSESAPFSKQEKNDYSLEQWKSEKTSKDEEDIIKVVTNLVVIPSQISDRRGKPVRDLQKEEFKIFENGIEQEIAYFNADEQPFTVALVLDMSYSSVFKLAEIQAAALAFINQLHANDKVLVVSFDEKVRILCEATDNRKALRLAIEGAKIASGTSLYAAMDLVLTEKMRRISGRKAVVLLSDNVDTSSTKQTFSGILQKTSESEVLIYPIQYDTYDDVQKSRKETAQIFYDENDRPYTIEKPREKGERAEDYRRAKEFAQQMAESSGGSVFRVSTPANLNNAFSRIAAELRQIYSIGYYPLEERKNGVHYAINVRVYRPDLTVRARNGYFWKPNQSR